MKIMPFTKRTEFDTYQIIIWHPKAKEIISGFPEEVRKELGYLMHLLQRGEKLSMPHSRPMTSIAKGAHELRVRGLDGVYRTFYYCKDHEGILVFHAFIKKTQQTSPTDINLGKKRLKELQES
ncbi:hypothetical protein D3C87_124570 [compost metagenome]